MSSKDGTRVTLLFVCTANRCRSPMAAALLDEALAERGVTGVEIGSAGLLPGGAPAASEARRLVAGLDDHVSHRISPSLVRYADLVVGMTRSHLREVTVLDSELFARTFTLKELARVAQPRTADETFHAWIRRIGTGRRMSALSGDADEDDVADPIGRKHSTFRAIADELRVLIDTFVDAAWPDARAIAS